MGNYASKVVEEIKEEKTESCSVPTTPILTPKVKILSEFDPRSPSTNIVRTPIQKLSSPNDSGIKENECDSFNIGSPVPKMLLQDPRSPTYEYMRTPIVVSANSCENQAVTKNLEGVRKTLTLITPKKISDMSSHVPPKLLESSPVTAKPNDNKRKSMVGVLETNLDYVETNIDEVITNKVALVDEETVESKESASDLKIKFFEQKTNEDNFEAASSSNGDASLNNTDNKRVIVDDDGLIIKSSSTVEEDEPTPKIDEAAPKVQDKVQSSEQEFAKKIATLIYTDEDSVLVNRQSKKQKECNRNPLGIRNGVPKLKVSDKPRKNEFSTCKIPIYRNKLSTQCENTPPKSMANVKAHRSKVAQWDSDNTLII
ncbi:PREDICTED: cell division cycle-associated protein 3-like [Nicrophorus vespilloides]|uniref:Cell division cycle-associated protein 3-like n=1 Tax=Nicrophorus vespilloides TaxID=110193 RepID=A0ABM1MT11_NICVS|nr:PREDICTED: cell division cycle-associated protein 3-like [Nicrophorus vespilloides]